MFLLVSGRHVGAHTDGHQHGVSIQISVNSGKINKIFRISRIRKTAVTRILARVFAYLPSLISQILDFIDWPVLFFTLIYFELRDTETLHISKSNQVKFAAILVHHLLFTSQFLSVTEEFWLRMRNRVRQNFVWVYSNKSKTHVQDNLRTARLKHFFSQELFEQCVDLVVWVKKEMN